MKTQLTKWIIGTIAVIAITTTAYAIKNNPEKNTAEPVRIGVVAPMTGNLAFIGEGLRDAIMLAQENAENTHYSYKVVFEDDQMDPKMTASATNKLISVDKVDAIISFGSGPGNVVAPIAQQNEVVHVGIASDSNIAQGSYNFIHWTPPSEENKVFVAELKRRDIKKLGIFESNTPGAAAVMANLQDQLKNTDIKIVTDQVFNMGEKDFRSIIAKARNSDAETYLLMAFSPELEVLAKQIKEAGITTPLTSIESFELSEQVDLFETEWYVNAADPTGDFTAKFEARTGKNPTLGAANAYDIFHLIVSAAEKTDNSTKPAPSQIAEELLNTSNFNGALGTLSVNNEGIVISKAAVRMIKDGKPVTVGK